MIEVDATQQLREIRPRLVLRPDEWVNKVAVSEQHPPNKQNNTEIDEDAVRGAAELIDGPQQAVQPTTVREAFQVWKGLHQQLESGQPVAEELQSVAKTISRLIGRSNESHARAFFVDAKPGVGQAFFP